MALTQDNIEAFDLSHVDDRDRIRRQAQQSMLRFANAFAANFDVSACRRNLEGLFQGNVVADIPAAILDRMANLEPVLDVERYPLTPEDKKRIEKIKVAFVIDRLLAYGAPGKRPVWDRDGAFASGFDAFMEGFQGDEEYLRRFRAYEAQYDRLFVFRLAGTDGKGSPTPPAVFRQNMASQLDALLSEPVNGAAARGLVQVLVDAVIEAHCGSLDRRWKLRQDWWALAHARPGTRSEAEGYSIVTGGQFFARRADVFAAGLDDMDALADAVSSVPSFTALVDGEWYPAGTVPGGTWRNSPETSRYEGAACMALVYDWPNPPATVPKGTPGAVAVCHMLLVQVDEIPYELDDRSNVASGFGSPCNDVPSYKVSDALRSMAAMLSVVDEPSSDLPDGLPDFDGPGGGGPTRYVRSRPIGSPF